MSDSDCTTPQYRDIKDFPGYRVADDGSVWSRRYYGRLLEDWHRLKGTPHPRYGHLSLTLISPDGHRCPRQIHRLVLEAFVGSCPPGMECCHADGNPANNNLSNLRWDTRKGNIADTVRHGRTPHGQKHHWAKLTEDAVRYIRRNKGLLSQSVMAKNLGIPRTTVAAIAQGRNWRHVQ